MQKKYKESKYLEDKRKGQWKKKCQNRDHEISSPHYIFAWKRTLNSNTENEWLYLYEETKYLWRHNRLFNFHWDRAQEWRGRAEREITNKAQNQELNLRLSVLVTGKIQFLTFKPQCLKKEALKWLNWFSIYDYVGDDMDEIFILVEKLWLNSRVSFQWKSRRIILGVQSGWFYSVEKV